MALILAAAVVVAVALPEVPGYDVARSRPGYLHPHRDGEFRRMDHGVSSPPALRTLPSPGYAEGDPWATAGPDDLAGAYAPESLDPREPVAILPALRRFSSPPLHDAGGIADLVEKWRPTLDYLKHCESRGDYEVVNPTSGAAGGYQFLASTWRSVGGAGGAEDAPPAEQDYRAALMLERGRRGEWVC